MSRVKGTNVTGAPIELTSGAPVDAKMLVDTKADLYTASTWQAPSAAGANAGKMFCYYGMLVYVGNDTPENNGLYVLQNSGADDANADATANSGANWVRISQTDTRINAIESDIDSIQSELENIPTADNVVLKTDISTVIPEEGAVDTKVASEKAVADAIGNFIETGSSARLTTLTIGNGTGAATVTLDTTNGITGSVIDETLPSSTGNAGRIPSTNAVVTAINEVKSSISGVYTYKGSVATYDDLPDDAEVGDVYNVEAAYGNYPAGTNYAWDGTKWDALGGSVDLSAYQTKNDESLTTTAKTVVGAINEINTSNSGKQDSSISIDGITADTVEGALTELDTDISALQKKTQKITQASSVSTLFTGTVNADTFSGTTIRGQTLTAGDQLTVNGSVTGSAIQTTLSASSTDQQLPSAKAVYDGLAAKQDALTYYEESAARGGSVTVGATTQAGTPPSAVTVANANISVHLTTSTLNTININGGILNRETAFKSTSQTGSIGIPSNVSSLAGYKVVFDTIASEGGAKSRTVFEYDATNNVWYREVIFGTGASITSMSGNTVNYDLGVAVSSANIAVSML